MAGTGMTAADRATAVAEAMLIIPGTKAATRASVNATTGRNPMRARRAPALRSSEGAPCRFPRKSDVTPRISERSRRLFTH